MKIAIPMEKKDIKDEICISFGRSQYYLIFDTESKKSVFIENTAAQSAGGAGIKASQLIVDSGAKVVITPRCGKNAADILIEANIDIYKSENISAIENIEKYLAKRLEPLNEIHNGFHKNG